MSLRNRMCSTFIKRQVHGNSEIVANCKEIRNRNPRNLERLRIARRPIGYALEKPGFAYWHKLTVKETRHYVSAEVRHFENGPVITASTQEWGFKKQLYRLKDTTSYINLARVIAQRCLECGINEVYIEKQNISGEKEILFMEEVEKNGVILEEPKRYIHSTGSVPFREEKPWESFE
ncbi:PREDICTED: 39S ribosomal protein L18, mitochondrial [Dufourea novaeangliae]|uniref:Large ribosomal subunit protein uL18m n=1 Tax=Dufourea novaeangliae TaxID=178035 RepID=A0A154NZM8_DUFNO|nr:PREDICTED: 39S ribosomal protein L18, mitochondrial [Dufourea novaeangliae]KZC04544.1 39S ribosomal protein L18, mitochondrial [Dufourea novaeangliae]